MARPGEGFDIAAEETPETDDEIAEKIEEIYSKDERIDATYIEYTVKDGVVHLEGAVSNQEEKEMAESLLDNIEGVRMVINDLQVELSDYNRPEPWPGREPEDIEEAENIDVWEPDEETVTEDHITAIEEGRAYVPPTEPIFPTERAQPAERMRERRAQREATGEARDQL